MTNEEFCAAGERLYGYGWQTALSKALGVNDRTVRRWVSGSTDIPKMVETAVNSLIAIRDFQEESEMIKKEKRKGTPHN